MKLHFMGTGNCAEVPCFDCDCPACERARSSFEYKRAPCSAEIELEGKYYLLDAGRMDLVQHCEHRRPEAILLTHYHADHVQGLLPLRWGKGLPIPVYAPDDSQGFADLYKNHGILDFRPPLQPFQSFALGAMTVIPVPLEHSKMTLGYAIEHADVRIAWLADTLGLSAPSLEFLVEWQADTVIVDANHPDSQHPSRNHNSLSEALALIRQLAPRQAWLIHIGHDLDRFLMEHPNTLPDNVYISKDGLVLEF